MNFIYILSKIANLLDTSKKKISKGNIEESEENLNQFQGEKYLLENSKKISYYLLTKNSEDERALICIAEAYFQDAYLGGLSYKKTILLKGYIWILKTLSINPKNEDARSLQALFLLYLKGPRQAAHLLDNIQNWRASFARGMIASVNDDPTQVELHLVKASDNCPKNRKAFLVNHTGVTLSMLGQTKKAIFYYRQAITIDPNFAWPYYNLGLDEEKIGNIEAANKYANEALSRMEFEYASDLDNRTKSD
ncbi:tetratricopeptide repeat protein [Microbulbifer echini]|uniref:Tetratricopeptide repeat protein n=1 Tax=Microbulbifer echini TaxID=1529067 RepID=A0ABV4NMV6_9GAMM